MLPFPTTHNHCICDVTGMCQHDRRPQVAEGGGPGGQVDTVSLRVPA